MWRQQNYRIFLDGLTHIIDFILICTDSNHQKLSISLFLVIFGAKMGSRQIFGDKI
jgi:hypothetical protein